jgi:hypothetical protein
MLKFTKDFNPAMLYYHPSHEHAYCLHTQIHIVYSLLGKYLTCINNDVAKRAKDNG